MIYVLHRVEPWSINPGSNTPRHELGLIGTAGAIRTFRDARARPPRLRRYYDHDADGAPTGLGRPRRGPRDHPWEGLAVLGQAEGDEATARAFIDRFGRPQGHHDDPAVVASPEMREWAATLIPWDGSNAELLGVKGPGKRKHVSVLNHGLRHRIRPSRTHQVPPASKVR